MSDSREYRVPRDRFPFVGHRTLAEVRETDRLLKEWDASPSRRWLIGPHLNALLMKAEAHNPPPLPPEGERA